MLDTSLEVCIDICKMIQNILFFKNMHDQERSGLLSVANIHHACLFSHFQTKNQPRAFILLTTLGPYTMQSSLWIAVVKYCLTVKCLASTSHFAVFYCNSNFANSDQLEVLPNKPFTIFT